MPTDELKKDLDQYISAIKKDAQQFFDLADRAAEVLFSTLADTSAKSPTIRINYGLYDGSGERALDVYASGIASNTATSDNTWGNLRYRKADLNRKPGVAAFQKDLEDGLYTGFARGNWYEVYSQMLREASVNGSAAAFQLRDKVRKISMWEIVPHKTFWVQRGIGEYIGFHREFYRTGKELLKLFPAAGSDHVERWQNGKYTLFLVCHTVRERDEVNRNDRSNLGFRFESVYQVENKIVDVGGYKVFPYLVYQPDPVSGTNWSLSPAIRAVRDAGMLQVVAETDLKVKQQAADPAREIRDDYKDEYITDPGAENPIPSAQWGAGPISRPVVYGNNLQATEAEMARLRTSIEAYFKVPFFLQTAMLEKTVTRAEFLGRQAADMATIKPMLDRLCSEVLDIAVQMELDAQDEYDQLPEVPAAVKDIVSEPLVIEYNSTMLTLLNRAHILAGVEHFGPFVATLAAQFPDQARKISQSVDLRRLVDRAAEADGVTDLLTDDDTRQQAADADNKAAIMNAQAQALQMQAQAVSHAQGNAPMPQLPGQGGAA